MDFKVINLGGVGGCHITDAINYLFQGTERYPYDWLHASQSFVINSFLAYENFFDFDDENCRKGKGFFSKRKDAFTAHDFLIDYHAQKEAVKAKYRRRFDRLRAAMEGPDPIMFVRMTDNEPRRPDWDDAFINEREDFGRWVRFVDELSARYQKVLVLLIASSNPQEVTNNLNWDRGNVFVRLHETQNIRLMSDLMISCLQLFVTRCTEDPSLLSPPTIVSETAASAGT